ncbi:MAG TPA: protein kinase [Kofleriaceae bacterium]|nr:protein kinase [Kofleriaceae bacterium]
MTCPSCNSPLEPNARFCGVCGYRLAPNRRAAPATPASAAPVVERARSASAAPPSQSRPNRAPGTGTPAPGGSPAAGQARPAGQARAPQPGEARQVVHPAAVAAQAQPAAQVPAGQAPAQKQPARAPAKPRKPSGDDVYLGQVLNNRFKIESKIGEGGFGAVYRGVQLATGRKVALKLLHPDMTKDDNLVARFRREGMVLCNLRDAHTITTYDFDQTPSGTLYIAMELLEGKSLHQVFHEEAPLEWKRVFKILTEMCSSLAEAHAQGIVHRDLKPENIYLESRSGNPEFVKILDFGIAKVMRGETIDPQSPQLTATGQTLGTLEYMSPEQLMGKALDGRSDVYALGVLAYEMITGRLPFPDAKGPAGLITAQLKQTPLPPSQACPQANLPRTADRAILKCLEKDKNNRYPDVSALAVALQEVIAGQSSELAALQHQIAIGRTPSADMLETRRGELPNVLPPPMPPTPLPPSAAQGSGMTAMPGTPVPGMQSAPGADRAPAHVGQAGPAPVPSPIAPLSPMMTPPVGSPIYAPLTPTPYPLAPGGPIHHGGLPMGAYPVRHPQAPRRAGLLSGRLLWWVIVLLAVGASAGTLAGILLSK